MTIYTGKSVFGGIAIGRLSVYRKDDSQVKRVHIDDPEAEIAKYHEAKETAIEQLGVLSDAQSVVLQGIVAAFPFCS